MYNTCLIRPKQCDDIVDNLEHLISTYSMIHNNEYPLFDFKGDKHPSTHYFFTLAGIYNSLHLFKTCSILTVFWRMAGGGTIHK